MNIRDNVNFENPPLIIFVDHAGGMQTRSTPSASVLIWSSTNDAAPCTINIIFATLPCYCYLGLGKIVDKNILPLKNFYFAHWSIPNCSCTLQSTSTVFLIPYRCWIQFSSKYINRSKRSRYSKFSNHRQGNVQPL